MLHDGHERLGRLVGDDLAILDLADGVLDHIRRLFGCFRTAGCEIPDLLRHDGEAFAVLAGPCCLDGGIERQDVRLESDLVDDLYDLRDIGRGDIDCLHGRQHFLHAAVAGLGLLPRDESELVGFLRIVGVAGRLRRYLRNRRRELLDRRCLLGCAL